MTGRKGHGAAAYARTLTAEETTMQTLQKRLFTATAEATGGRNGSTHNGTGVVNVPASPTVDRS
jgi:hypothetical protein